MTDLLDWVPTTMSNLSHKGKAGCITYVCQYYCTGNLLWGVLKVFKYMSYNCLSKTTLALPLSGLIGTTTACGRHSPPNRLRAHRTCGEVTDLHSYVANYNALKICQIRKRWLDGLSLWSAILSCETNLFITLKCLSLDNSLQYRKAHSLTCGFLNGVYYIISPCCLYRAWILACTWCMCSWREVSTLCTRPLSR